ncbi:MAG: hypothetical protein NT157_02145 [Candidatus Micrarchaeota archaeon]|nr:hypothetical protein [Candidatus Micrarchaeota archaeon]
MERLTSLVELSINIREFLPLLAFFATIAGSIISAISIAPKYKKYRVYGLTLLAVGLNILIFIWILEAWTPWQFHETGADVVVAVVYHLVLLGVIISCVCLLPKYRKYWVYGLALIALAVGIFFLWLLL